MKKNEITLHVKGHKVCVKDSIVVHVYHNKKVCKNPCPLTEDVLSYLEAELFVNEDSYVFKETWNVKKTTEQE